MDMVTVSPSVLAEFLTIQYEKVTSGILPLLLSEWVHLLHRDNVKLPQYQTQNPPHK